MVPVRADPAVGACGNRKRGSTLGFDLVFQPWKVCGSPGMLLSCWFPFCLLLGFFVLLKTGLQLLRALHLRVEQQSGNYSPLRQR